MTKHRRMLKSANGIVLSDDVSQNIFKIVGRYYVTSCKRSEPLYFIDLEKAEAFFDEEAL
jgi:hypothetical protein